MKVFALTMISFLAILLHATLATPFLHDPQPANNSFISGGVKAISINITDDNLNPNSVLLHIISLNAYEQGEDWDIHTLSCINSTNEWKCSKNISFAIAGSDIVELFYFEANDTDGVTGYNGTTGNPFKFTLDRSPPVISFVNPTNNSYVSGNETISITVIDLSSGVNNNTVQYALDSSEWVTMKNVSLDSFEDVWNTTTFSNNQTVILHVKASDNVGNVLSTNITVMVDNEIPDIEILSPSSTTLTSDAQLEVNVSDYYSGVDLTNVRYNVNSLSGTLGCTGNKYNATCSAILSTSDLPDGNHTLAFTVTDNAGNSKTASVEINTSNTQPSISIIEPINNDFLKETVLVRATLRNTAGIVKYVEISVGSLLSNMTCDSDFGSCKYSLNTASFADGRYGIRTNVINNLDIAISSSISVTIDNTKPGLNITQPTTEVKGDFEIKADVVDVNLNQINVVFTISSFNGSLACTPQTPSKFICSTFFNSKKLNDGKYILNISAGDKSGNIAFKTKEITIANYPQTVSDGTGGTPPENETNETGEISEEQKPSGISFPSISLPFKTEYLILGVIVTAVIIVVIILSITIRHRPSETIITGQ